MLYLIALLIAALLASCGGSPDDDKNATIDPPSCAASACI